MTGPLSTLGLGSQGALSYDIIDKLKAADEATIIKPVNRKISALQSQKQSLSSITSLANDLKSAVEELTSTTFQDSRTTSVSGSSVVVEAKEGAQVQDFTLNVDHLATRDIHQSQKFATKDATFTNDSDTITFSVGDTTFSVDVDANTTLNDLVGLINEKSDGKVKASLLNVGGDTPYELILTSAETGTANNITMSANGSALSDLGITEIQNAQDAGFTFNGIEITRGTNTFDDMLTGVSLTLKEAGITKVSIEQDTETIVKKVKDFTDKYNALIDAIQNATKFDPDTLKAGAMQGISEMNTLKSGIRDVLDAISVDGKRLQDAGIEIDRYGKMSLDEEAFTKMLTDDPKALTNLFRGDTLTETTDDDGVMTKLHEKLKELATGHDSLLKNLSSEFDEKLKSLEENREKAQKRLDNRYEILAKKFASFDAMIGRMNNQFSSLEMIIQTQTKQK